MRQIELNCQKRSDSQLQSVTLIFCISHVFWRLFASRLTEKALEIAIKITFKTSSSCAAHLVVVFETKNLR